MKTKTRTSRPNGRKPSRPVDRRRVARSPRGSSELRYLLARAERLLVHARRYPDVVGVGIGRRRRGTDWTHHRVITVFVRRKLQLEDLSPKHVIPASLMVSRAGDRLRLPTDVVAVGAARGRAQVLAPGDVVRGAIGKGCLSWVSGSLAITAAHVAGFDSTGKEIQGQSGSIGTVTRLGYEISKVDAALIALSTDVTVSSRVAGVAIGRARYINDSDLFSPTTGRMMRVYSPRSGTFRSVALRHVHVGPFFPLVNGDGTEFTPRPLAMTDFCTEAGDSGTVLLGEDDRPLALLSGAVDADDGFSYSCFTELGPALDALDVTW